MDKPLPPIKIVIGGTVSLVIVMGVARFAYTPILPLMQKATGFSEALLGYLASSNYLGYLVGALMASLFKWNKGKPFYLRFYLVINIMATIVMGLTTQYWLWFIFRFVSGVTSGIVFVLASSVVLDILARNKRPTWSGLFYSGVGIGIFTTGLLVPALDFYYGWQGAWIGLGIVSALIGIVAFLWLKETVSQWEEAAQFTEQIHSKNKKAVLPWLIASYGCEGVGYVISGTFLVAFVEGIPALSGFASLSWVFVGLAVMPSCIIWPFLAKKWGNLLTLQIALFTQIVGVMLPVFLFNTYGALIGAFLFGGTFVGITILSVQEARNIAPQESNKVIGYLTFFYGVGQMIGPAIAGVLITHSGNYHSSLIFAFIVLLCGMVLLGIGQFHSQAKYAAARKGSSANPM